VLFLVAQAGKKLPESLSCSCFLYDGSLWWISVGMKIAVQERLVSVAEVVKEQLNQKYSPNQDPLGGCVEYARRRSESQTLKSLPSFQKKLLNCQKSSALN